MGFIRRSRANLPAENFFAVEQFLAGARRAAERMGLSPDHLPDREHHRGRGPSGPHSQVAGIWGIIIGALDAGVRELSLDWDYFSGLCIESQHLGLSLHTVANNQSGSTRTAVRRLFELGYRRIGLAVGEIEETSLGKPFTAGYLVEVHEYQGLRSLPPLLLRSDDPAATAAKLGRMGSTAPDRCGTRELEQHPDLLRLAGLDIPRDVAWPPWTTIPTAAPSRDPAEP